MRACSRVESEGPGPGLWYQGREAGQRDPFPVLWVVIYDLVRYKEGQRPGKQNVLDLGPLHHRFALRFEARLFLSLGLSRLTCKIRTRWPLSPLQALKFSGSMKNLPQLAVCPCTNPQYKRSQSSLFYIHLEAP